MAEQTLAGYRLVRQIQAGDHVAVYLALEVANSRRLALKVLPRHAPEEARERFRIELQTMQKLQHPNIVPILRSGRTEQWWFYAMPFYGAGDLHRRMMSGLTVEGALRIAAEVAAALGHAHAHGVVHGDVTPSNILINDRDRAQLGDFGLFSGGSPAITVRATPDFLSPEQAMGQLPDSRSDLYSLGLVLYWMLAGDVPFRGRTPGETAQARLHNRPPPLSADLSVVAPLVDRLLAREPDRRPNSAAEVHEELIAIELRGSVPRAKLRNEPIQTGEIPLPATSERLVPEVGRSRPRNKRGRAGSGWMRPAIAAGGAVLLSGAAGLGWLWFSEDRELGPTAAEPAVAERMAQTPEGVALRATARALRQAESEVAAQVDAWRALLVAAPEDPEALQALRQIEEQIAEQVVVALQSHDSELADERLERLRAQFPGSSRLQALEQARAAADELSALLDEAANLVAAGRLMDPGEVSAFSIYREVLEAAPGDLRALQGMDAIADSYLDLAMGAFRSGAFDRAIHFLERAQLAAPEHPRLAETQDLLRDARDRQRNLRELIDRAQLVLKGDELTEPAAEDAARLFLQVLAEQPDNPYALAGMQAAGAWLLDEARTRIGAGDLEGASLRLDTVRSFDHPIEGLEVVGATLQARSEQRERAAELLDIARRQQSAGALSVPVGSSARDTLLEAAATAPDSGAVRTARQALGLRFAELAAQAQVFELNALARRYFLLALEMSPERVDWRAALEEIPDS